MKDEEYDTRLNDNISIVLIIRDFLINLLAKIYKRNIEIARG